MGTKTIFAMLATLILGVTVLAQTNIAEVKIGEQLWSAKNLDIGHFRNGDAITEAKTAEEWQAAEANGEPAWCYYEYNSQNGNTYGKYYNWYAVSDPRGLAPEEWRVATDEDWQQLERFLGVPEDEIHLSTGRGESNNVGGKLKSKTGWDNPNRGATNESGFAALPGGMCGPKGDFSQAGRMGFWWTSSMDETERVWFRFLYHGFPVINRVKEKPTGGLTVRLVKE
jgi:uncharacterized protein (TIGR02145 family)